MNNEFISALKQIAAERGLEVGVILEAIKEGIKQIFAEKNPEGEGASIQVEIDTDSSQISVYADKKVVKEVTNPATQILESDAKKLQPKLKEGDHVLVEITHTGDFGRIAAQATRQVMMQKIKEAEQDAIFAQFKDKIGTIDTAIVQRMDREGNLICEIYRAIAKMPPEEQIQSEFYQSGSRIKVYLKRINEDAKGKTLIISRSDSNFLRALFDMEVPEISSGTVEIMAIAREAGARSKVAVASNAQGVDPIGSCVGQRGSRINAITNELKTTRGEEKIDIIPWDEDIKTYIGNSIRPATAVEVRIINDVEKQALVLVDDEYLSLAIGREGQNARLANKLTGWKIDIQGVKAFNENGGKSKFELDAEGKQGPDSKATKAKQEEAGSELDVLGLSTRVVGLLAKAGVTTVADLKTKIEADEKIAGVGPKAVEEIKLALAKG